MLELVCPVSGERIDRNVVRTNGLLTTVGCVVYTYLARPLLRARDAAEDAARAAMAGAAMAKSEETTG